MRRLFSALAFLTIIPIPERLKSQNLNAMFAGYPGAGLVIGALLAGSAAVASLLLPGMLVAVALIATNLALTGGIHLDGLADCADAFYGRRDRSRVLEILKDPRIGTMGGAAIGLSLLTRFAALSILPAPGVAAPLVLSAVLSRTAVLVGLRLLPYVRSRGGILAPGSQVSLPLTIAAAVVLAAVGVLAPIPTAVALAAVGSLWLISRRKICGCTGDVLGASIELAEIVFLAAFAAEASHGALHGLLDRLLRLA